MAVTPSWDHRFSLAIGDDDVRFGDTTGSSLLPPSAERLGRQVDERCSAERYEWAPRAAP